MRIAYVNQDRGVRVGRSKGASVHVSAMRAAFERVGAEVLALDEADDEVLRACLEHRLAAGSLDLVYERYALGRVLATSLCAQYAVPHVLEVNAPLLIESERYRGRPLGRDDHARERAIFRNSTRVLCVSTALADYVTRVRGTSEGVDVVPNAVGPEFLGVPETVPGFCTPGRVVVGFHGRLRPWHAFDRTVSVVRKLVDLGRDVELAVVGRGEFDELVGLLPRNRVVRAPWVDPERVAGHVARFDIVLLPYRADAPPWFSPLKLAEAMSCGAVPVVTEVGDLPSCVEHEVSGLVVPAADEQALLDATLRLVDDDELRAALSSGARSRGRARTWDDVARDVLPSAAPRRIGS